MKKIIYLLSLVFILSSTQSHAARFGKGKSFGQHSSSQRSNNNSNQQKPQQQQNNQNQQHATPPPAAPKPSLMSRMFPMLAGLTAGALLGSLLSGSGLGGAMGSILIGLLGAAVVFFIVRKLMSGRRPENKFNNFQHATQSAQANYSQPQNSYQEPVNYAPSNETVNNNYTPTPINNNALSFYQEEFLRTAKTTFIRMQNAYDTKNLTDIRSFTTPEVFAEIQMQIQERGDKENFTEVMTINSSLLEMNEYNNNGVVQFTGKIREDKNSEPVEINEMWNFVKNENTWLIAGIEQKS